MILHGNARGHGRNLAIHLLRDDENDHVEVHEVRGFMAEDVAGAFQEARAMASATKAQKYLFSLSLSPPKDGSVSAAEFESAIEKIEAKLGLAGQPRVIVFHEKGDNRDRHAHAVWSRVDSEAGKVIPLAYNRMKLRDVSRELFIQHGWDMPPGLINRDERNPLNYTFEQYQHAKRVGKDAKQIKADLQDAWAMSDSRAAFEHALKDKGFSLARGDRRGFVAVNTEGEPFSIPKWLDLKTKAVRERLGKEAELPPIAEVKATIGRDMASKLGEYEQVIAARNAKRKEQALIQRKAFVEQQRSERAAALQAIKARTQSEALARQARFRTGLKGVWDWVRGENKRIRQENEAEAKRALARDTAEKEALITAQREQRQLLMRRLQQARDKLKEQHASVAQDRKRYTDMANAPPVDISKRERAPTCERLPRRQSASAKAEHAPDAKEAFKQKRRAASQRPRRQRGPTHER